MTINAVFDPASPTSGIQEAIDALGEAGGSVHIPAGAWPLRRSIVMPSRIQLMGDGPSTELTVTPPKILSLARDARKGSRSVHVCGRVPFALGDEVSVVDDKRQWWLRTYAVVTAVEGRTVRLSAPLEHSLKVKENARLVSVFPGITTPGTGDFVGSKREIGSKREPVYDLVVRDLALQGANGSAPEHYWGDFTLSAVHLVYCHRARITNVSVFDWLSDGISIQGGADVQVTHCQVRGNSCNGLHPGGGLKRSIWSHNVGVGNNHDGLFVCGLVYDSVISDNVFSGNGSAGIGGLGYADCHHNVIANNVCSENGKWGIENDDTAGHLISGDELRRLRGGYLITGNMLRNNSQKEPGVYAALRLHNAQRFLVQGNRCTDDQARPTQRRGIVESGASDWNLISGNMCVGLEEPVTIVGANSRAEGNLG
ncbi:MAG: hypothetical protein GKR89_28565 [Candidatus Latescibacteria bacterium]|nr:hypothetical protein [Candidatus Latescibacterota bacterium]